MHKQRSRCVREQRPLPCLRFSFVSDCQRRRFGAEEQAAEARSKRSDHKDFDNSANVDNKWFRWQPGLSWSTGFTQEDEKRVPARVVQTVTDLTKVVNGVRAIVVWMSTTRTAR